MTRLPDLRVVYQSEDCLPYLYFSCVCLSNLISDYSQSQPEQFFETNADFSQLRFHFYCILVFNNGT